MRLRLFVSKFETRKFIDPELKYGKLYSNLLPIENYQSNHSTCMCRKKLSVDQRHE